MVDFMLDANGQQAFRFQFKFLAIGIQCPDSHFGRAFDFIVDAGKREATFLEYGFFLTGLDDLGVDENSQFVFLF